jgi:hypothetical protein
MSKTEMAERRDSHFGHKQLKTHGFDFDHIPLVILLAIPRGPVGRGGDAGRRGAVRSAGRVASPHIPVFRHMRPAFRPQGGNPADRPRAESSTRRGAGALGSSSKYS